MVYVMGLNLGHNACAALLHDGRIEACLQEERLTRIKNISGLPANAIAEILKLKDIDISDIDLVVYSQIEGPPTPGGGVFDVLYTGLRNRPNFPEYLLPPLTSVKERVLRPYFQACNKIFARRRMDLINRYFVGTAQTRVVHVNHHLCHSAAPAYGFRYFGPVLILTLDGEGDDLCATVNKMDDQRISTIALTHRDHSLGYVYNHITKFLGMKVLEDEYKVMGLAPYSDTANGSQTMQILSSLLTLDPKDQLRFTSRVRTDFTYYYATRKLRRFRFDHVASGVQRFTETLVSKWVEHAIQRTGLSNVCLSGGVFMNVKLNMMISKMKCVDGVLPFPSCGDESNAIGAAYYGYKLICERLGKKFDPEPLENLYLGPEFDEEYIKQCLKKNDAFSKFRVEYHHDIEGVVSSLLANSHVVARFSGRMEWGARALGNRSILANPSNQKMVREINFMIKKRDFWMPFAPTILAERQSEYLVNDKNIDSPFMNMAFETNPRTQNEIIAAVHPYDFTARPQILSKRQNPSFYELIRHFEAATGVGGVLNTSFNLHGEPIVCSPEDALRTFERSELGNLALGNFLIRKRGLT